MKTGCGFLYVHRPKIVYKLSILLSGLFHIPHTPAIMRYCFSLLFLWVFATTTPTTLVAQDSLVKTTATDTLDLADSIQTTIDTLVQKFEEEKRRYEIHAVETNMLAKGDKYQLEVKAIDDKLGTLNTLVNGDYDFTVDSESKTLNFKDGIASLELEEMPKTVFLKHDDAISFNRFKQTESGQVKSSNLPLWTSLLPPLIAIILALVFREVVASLFLGIWAGAFLLGDWSFQGFFSSLLGSVDKFVLGALNDADHLSVILFSLLIGGMVAVISRNGGMSGVVNSLSRFAKSARSSQLVTWFLGIAIFFDDYANTLIVGNTARSLTDRYRVSREKLAYIVDSTAAPVAAIALITTWIGAELGYIGDALAQMGDFPVTNSYSIFLSSLQYSFYPILTLIFILMIVIFRRDYGPMLKAERRARTTGQLFEPVNETDGEEIDLDELTPVKDKPHYAINAVIPILTVVLATLIGMIHTGGEGAGLFEKLGNAFSSLDALRNTIGNSNSYVALIWSSTLGVIVAVTLTLTQRILPLRETMDSFLSGIKTMIGAMVILVLAWSLAKVTQDLHTATYLTGLLDGNVSPIVLPVITFILAGAIAFSTGSSWSTMAILYPIILPAAWQVSLSAGLDPDICLAIFFNCTSSVLAGSVFGDHCSPISDTTILSSLACNCNHIDHVRTQLPYALTVAVISIVLSYCAMAFNLPFIVSLLIGITFLFAVLVVFGRQVPEAKTIFEPAPVSSPEPTFIPAPSAPEKKPKSITEDPDFYDDEDLLA